MVNHFKNNSLELTNIINIVKILYLSKLILHYEFLKNINIIQFKTNMSTILQGFFFAIFQLF